MSTSKDIELSKKELIKKLEAISELHSKALSIKRKMDNFVPEDSYERKIIMPLFPGQYKDHMEREYWAELINHEDEDAVEQIAHFYDSRYQPKKPVEPKTKEFKYSDSSESQQKQMRLGCFSSVAAGISGFFFLSIIIGTAEGAVSTILIISIIFGLLFAFLRYKLKNEKTLVAKKRTEALAEYTRFQEELMAEYNEQLKNYENECVTYELRKKEFLDAYRSWQKIYLESAKEEREIAEKLETDRRASVEIINTEEYEPVLLELDELNDLITTEYLPVIDTIIELLKSGRADDLKEAINLYEDIVYRERQLELQREMEEQRQYEEAMKLEAQERQHQENMNFQKAQEERRAREFKELQQEAEKKEKEAKKREEERQRAEKREAEKKCHWCTNWSNCALRRNPPLNCMGFRPGSTHHI